MRPRGTLFVDRIRHMILPAATLGLVLYGEYALIVRSAMLETLGEDYVLTARAKGLSNWATVWRHGLRNALLPIVTLDRALARLHHRRVHHRSSTSSPIRGSASRSSRRSTSVTFRSCRVHSCSSRFRHLLNLLADLLYFKLDPRITE